MSTKRSSSAGIPLLPETRLLKLARRHFKDDYNTDVDPKIFKAVARGEVLDVTEGKGGFPKKWSKKRILKADRIAWLCHNIDAKELVSSFGVQIRGFLIEGDLECQHIHVGFSLLMENCYFTKDITIQYSRIYSLSLCSSFCNSIVAIGAKISSGVYLGTDFSAQGPIIFIDTKIGGSLHCSGGKFNYVGEIGAFDCSGAKISGGVYLRNGFKAQGQVNFNSANIGGNLVCEQAQFNYVNSLKPALKADNLKIAGSIYLREGFVSQGGVEFSSAEVNGQISCGGGHFKYDGENLSALAFNGTKVGTGIFLDKGFLANGTVDLCAAEIGINLDCTNGHFNCPDDSLYADGIEVGKYVLFRNCSIDGRICLTAAQIGVGLVFQELALSKSMNFDLRNARTRVFLDSQNSWPAQGKLQLHGFEYDSIDKNAPLDVKSRIKWIELQDNNDFDPQPYEHLESVLRKMGHVEDAIDIGVAKEKKRVDSLKEKYEKTTPDDFFEGIERKIEMLWEWFYGGVTFWGYRPIKYTATFLLILLLIGWIFYEIAFRYDIMMPSHKHADVDKMYPGIVAMETNNTKEMAELRSYPSFQGFVYSADALIPLVQFNQTSFWQPNLHGGAGRDFSIGEYHWRVSWGGVVMFWMYFQIVMGWVLLTFSVYGIAGMVRKKE